MPTTISKQTKNNGTPLAPEGPGAAAFPPETRTVLEPGHFEPGHFEPGRKKALGVFQKTAHIHFKDLKLLNLALMHRSLSNEGGYRGNNERLEFLGDAILGAVTATLLYEELEDRPEGDLAKIKSAAVSEDILSSVARELQIDSLLLLGKGEELSGGRGKNAILADALEAVIGALYLDSGYKAASDFVGRWMREEIHRVRDNRHHRDYKSLLQELSQRLFRSYPVYHLIKRSGPDHARLFWIEVRVNEKNFGPGMGKSKKIAEQEAAKLAYDFYSGEGASAAAESRP